MVVMLLASINKENESLHEAFLRQKSRNQWLNLRDRNNAYNFHEILRVRNSKNLITLLNCNGSINNRWAGFSRGLNGPFQLLELA